MEQTVKQIGTLEQQINSIESANINRETLSAMEKAGKAMQDINHDLTPEKVDETMYVPLYNPHLRRSRRSYDILDKAFADDKCDRDKLREQNALSDEIVEAMSGPGIGQDMDQQELEDELEQLQQEQLDEDMLKTGTVPVADAVHKMPSPANAEREFFLVLHNAPLDNVTDYVWTAVSSKKQTVDEDDDAELEKLRAEMAM